MSKTQPVPREIPVIKFLSLKICPELYDLLAKEAMEKGDDLIDVAVRRLAQSLRRPDLAEVPRKPRGGSRPGAGRRAASTTA